MSTLNNFITTGLGRLFENKFGQANYRLFIYFFALCCAGLIALTFKDPIGDFGNYYYGSKFFREGTDPVKIYQDIHFFNEKIKVSENGIFFENYTPVPPFSLIFYLPFTFLNLLTAKLIFNLLCVLIFCFSLHRIIKTLQIFSLSFYFLPFIFLQALHSNFHHGQAYLLIAALLFELYIAWQNEKRVTIALIIAFLFALKIFPAFMAIIFIFKKDFKTIGWIVLACCVLQLFTFLTVGNATMAYYYMDVFPRLALNDVTEPFSNFNQSVYTFLLNGFVFHPYLNPLPAINATIIAVIILCAFYSFVFTCFVKAILKTSAIGIFFFTILTLAVLNKYSTVYGLIIFFPFIFLIKEITAKKIAAISVLIFLTCSIPVYKLNNLPLFFQYPRPWLLLSVFLILVRGLKLKFELKYFAIGFILFMLPSLVFYKFETEITPEFRPETGVVYDFEIEPAQIKLYTCIGNRDTVEVFQYRSDTIDSTTFRAINPLNNKAVFVNNKYVAQLCDDNTGVGMYYLKLTKPKRVE